MNKVQFLSELRSGLKGIPKNEINDRLQYYSEMIEDRKDEGVTEEEAVSQMGTVSEIADQIIAECPVGAIVKEKIKPKRRLNAFEIILIVLGSPLWLSILIALFACVIAVYAVLWSVLISLWAVFIALGACFLAGFAGLVVYVVRGNIIAGIALLGAGLFSGGLAIFMFFGCLAITKGIIKLTNKIAVGIKRLIIGKR